MTRDQKTELKGSVAWGIGILLLAVLANYARRQGHLDHDSVMRLVIGTNGLMIAWFGNRMPKAFVPSTCAQKVRRVGGWSMMLSGLLYASLWALAPIPVAVSVGTAAVVVGIAVTVGYCMRMKSKRSVTT